MCESALRCPSLVQSPLSVQHSKTVPRPKYSTHSLHILFLFFLWDLVFVAQSKTKEEICWVELTPLWVISSLSSISCSKSTFCSVHKDSPVAKTITHSLHILFLFFLWDLVFAAQIKTKEEISWVKLTPLLVISS